MRLSCDQQTKEEENVSEAFINLNEEAIKADLEEMTHQSVEGNLNALLYAEADRLINAFRRQVVSYKNS